MLFQPTTPKASQWGVARYNANEVSEDGYVVSKRGEDRLYAVIDGHGGREAVDFLEDRLADYVFEELDLHRDDVELALKCSLKRMDRDFLERVLSERASKKRKRPRRSSQHKHQRLVHVGACVVMILVKDDRIYCCNAGDCRAVLGNSAVFVTLSNDHKASNAVEMSRCKSLCTSDPIPIRRTKEVKDSDAKSVQHLPLRVAGSLAITRAVGDGYLKISELSYPPYDAHVPYLSYPCEGEVISRNLTDCPKDCVLVLASDGLWDFVSCDEALGLCEIYQNNEDQKDSSQLVAGKILDHTLENIASSFRMSQDKLKSIKAGKKRRKLHDDITVLVVRM
jgi:serine/threonine protein phosphatase PrpC